MPRERLSRITLLLPTPLTPVEFERLSIIIGEVVDFAHGATVSSISPTVFDGFWLDDGQLVEDANIMLIADCNVPMNSSALADYLDNLKRRCQRDFNQDIIWLTVHEVDRVTTDDRFR